MILIRLTGGLGNQMFQYAFGKALALKRGVPLKLDVSLLGDNEKISRLVVRHFDLDAFPLNIEFATRKEIEDFNGKSNPTVIDRMKFRLNKMLGRYPLIIQRGQQYDEKQMSEIGKEACIIGRWQSEMYFKGFETDIRAAFSLKAITPNSYSRKIAEKLTEAIPVGVHVRRGDYVTHPDYSVHIGALTKQYYLDAISLLKSKMPDVEFKFKFKFLFISDDIEWCRNNFASVPGAVFVEQEKGKVGYLSDLWLLTLCTHCVISNSTFSWWGAWLGERPNSVIIAPEKWAKTAGYDPKNIIPDRWVKLKNTFEQL